MPHHLTEVFTQQATYVGDGSLGQHSMYRLELSTPIVVEDEDSDTPMRYALAYQNDRPDDAFEYGQVFVVQFRERVNRKPFSPNHAIVDILSVVPAGKAQVTQGLERDVAVPHRSATRVEASKERRKICFQAPESVIQAFDQLCEDIAGDYAPSNKRYRTLKVLLEHYLESHPF